MSRPLSEVSTKINKSSRNLPDFLGIGGARCGSTWLYTNLKAHPEIWLPPRKELHYFDRPLSYNSPSHLADNKLFDRLLSREQHNKKFRFKAVTALTKSVLRPEQFVWNVRFFFGTYNDDWYASLFEQGKDKVCGEITPAYSILNEKDVAHIRSIMPEAKIIFVIRNPIDRTWSGFCKSNLATESEEKLAYLLKHPNLRSDYIRTISIWRNAFPKEQFYIAFFDDILLNPESFLLKIFSFLGVSVDEAYLTAATRKRINVKEREEIPRRVKVMLARHFLADIAKLNDMMGGYTEKWLKEARLLLNEDSMF